ncbi:NUDIX hydrolase [Nonomuraea wenchangensis]|uniref:NUDIX hydrolase n=1 Tax=Nonomuraea wenchangensis TaxID=568860 RepID=UPI003330F808
MRCCCHRSAGRRWYPDVWDLPGGHVEDGEDPKESLVRELREELRITASQPSGPSCMRSGPRRSTCRSGWSTGGPEHPVNAAPGEHDAVEWFETSDLGSLRLAHESFLSMLTAVLIGDLAPEARGRAHRQIPTLAPGLVHH